LAVLIVNRVAEPPENTISIVPLDRRVVEIGSSHQIILRSAASAPRAQTCK
jgi:hypothetical protein